MPRSSSLGLRVTDAPLTTTMPRAVVSPLHLDDHNYLTASRSSSDGGARLPRRLLISCNAALFVFHAGLATTTLLVGNPQLAVPLYRTALNYTTFRNGTEFKLVPSYEVEGDLAFTKLVTAFFGLSAGFHLLNVLIAPLYMRLLAECRTPTRWIEYTFSAPIMVVLIAYMTGVRERTLLLCIAVLVGTTMFFGHWVEDVARPRNDEHWSTPRWQRLLPWFLGNVPQIAAWFVVVSQLYTNDSGEQNIPSFVFVILWSELVLFFSFGFVQLAVQLLPPRRYYQGELAFQFLSLVSKGVLGGLLLANVVMLSSFEEAFA